MTRTIRAKHSLPSRYQVVSACNVGYTQQRDRAKETLEINAQRCSPIVWQGTGSLPAVNCLAGMRVCCNFRITTYTAMRMVLRVFIGASGQAILYPQLYQVHLRVAVVAPLPNLLEEFWDLLSSIGRNYVMPFLYSSSPYVPALNTPPYVPPTFACLCLPALASFFLYV